MHARWSDFRDIWSESIGDRFLQISEEQTTVFDFGDDQGEVIIEENHVCLFTHILTDDIWKEVSNKERTLWRHSSYP